MAESSCTVGKYLLSRLREVGVKHVFGVPGDFVIHLCSEVTQADTGLKWVGCCNELNAGYAADGYARQNGIGCCMVTWGVGEMSAVNAVAGSFVEHVPVVLIAGAPKRSDRKADLPLHHRVGEFTTAKKMFKRITVANAFLEDPNEAVHQIDHCLSVCLRKKGPVYICIPLDVVDLPCPATLNGSHAPLKLVKEEIDEVAVKECAEEAARMLNEAKQPLIMGDCGVLRHGLKAQFRELVERSGMPFTLMLMAKGMIEENHAQFIGNYSGRRSKEPVWQYVETCDCILQLGAFPTDKNFGDFTVNLSRYGLINVPGDERAYCKGHLFEGVPLHTFIEHLLPLLKKRPTGSLAWPKPADFAEFSSSKPLPSPEEGKPLTSTRLFHSIASKGLNQGALVVADAGVAFFGASEMILPPGANFLAQIYYISIGYTLPAAFGAALASPNRKVMLIIGDGASQMTIQELSSMIREKENVSVILINNDGYTVERLIHEGKFNDIQRWNYHKLPEAFGSDKPGVLVKTETELDSALAMAAQPGFSFIEVCLQPMDAPDSLSAAAVAMKKHASK